MEQGRVWREFTSLPPEYQQQVADFIAFLRYRYEKLRSIKKGTDEALVQRIQKQEQSKKLGQKFFRLRQFDLGGEVHTDRDAIYVERL